MSTPNTPDPTPDSPSSGSASSGSASSGSASSGSASSGSASSGSAGLPPAPWILLDRTTATQAATVLDRIAQWLAGAGEPDAVAACAAAYSLEEDDEISVAAWLDALAARLTHRIEESDSWTGPGNGSGREGSWS
jgi:hypothetical protein